MKQQDLSSHFCPRPEITSLVPSSWCHLCVSHCALLCSITSSITSLALARKRSHTMSFPLSSSLGRGAFSSSRSQMERGRKRRTAVVHLLWAHCDMVQKAFSSDCFCHRPAVVSFSMMMMMMHLRPSIRPSVRPLTAGQHAHAFMLVRPGAVCCISCCPPSERTPIHDQKTTGRKKWVIVRRSAHCVILCRSGFYQRKAFFRQIP